MWYFLSFNIYFYTLIQAIFCIMYCVPAYLYPQVNKIPYNDTTYDSQDILNISDSLTSNFTIRYMYRVGESELSRHSNGFIWKSMFYLQALMAKLVPCLILVVFTLLLISSLFTINKNKKKLERMSNSYSKVKTTSVTKKFFKVNEKNFLE